jgi:hypothetical protein
LLAVLGLLLGPLARPATAAPIGGSAADAVHHATMDMPSGMDCCPDQAPARDCGKDCPLMAICTAQAVAPAAVGLNVPMTLSTVIHPGSHARVDSVRPSPPPRPPKRLS